MHSTHTHTCVLKETLGALGFPIEVRLVREDESGFFLRDGL